MTDTEVYFIAGCAVENDIVYLATQLDPMERFITGVGMHGKKSH
ncbi:hypothetical protein [Paraburkholderia bannensis]|nr:hypothetical protein [Paraburkholderia bannensis]